MTLCKYSLVLLIDDNYIDNMINQKILQGTHFAEQVVISQSTEEALAYLKIVLKAGKPVPQVIFVDIRMPGKNGFQFLDEFETIKNNYNFEAKIIVLSASLDPTDYKKVAENKSVVCFANKPLSQNVLNTI
jgi:CheY-like chemotaxis protein